MIVWIERLQMENSSVFIINISNFGDTHKPMVETHNTHIYSKSVDRDNM